MHPLTAAALVAGSFIAVRGGRGGDADARLSARITSLRTPGRDAVVRVATDAGSLYGVGVVAGLAALSGRPSLARRLALAGGSAWAAAQAAKPLLPRDRPYEVGEAERIVVVPAGTSWPSGHAAVAAALADVLGQGRGPLTRRLLGAAAWAVGATRVYVGVHHPTDVVAGLGVGSLSATLVRAVSRR